MSKLKSTFANTPVKKPRVVDVVPSFTGSGAGAGGACTPVIR